MTASHSSSHGNQRLLALALGAVGVVYGDIGTSPLYAFRETFASHHGAPGIKVDPVHIEGVLSLVCWSWRAFAVSGICLSTSGVHT